MTKPKPGAKLGRPPKPGGAMVRIAFRAPPEFAKALEDAAATANVTASEYVRDAVDAKLRRKR